MCAERRAAHPEVLLDGLDGLAAQRDQPLLAPLAADPQRFGELVEVLDVQPDQLADAQPGGVDRLEDRPVAGAQQRGRVGGGQKGLDLLDVQALRQAAVLAGGCV